MVRGILASVVFGIAASVLAQPTLVEYQGETSTFFAPTPSGIASGPSGLVWFVNVNAAHSIGTVTLAGDTTGVAQPPGDMATGAITGAPATLLWAGASKNILKITRDATPTFGLTFTLFPLPDPSLYHTIDSIGWDGATAVWFTDFVGGSRKLGRLDTTSGAVVESVLSSDCANPGGFGRDMVRGSDGNVWFTSSNGACRILADGSVALQPVTSPAGGITSGPDGRIWVAEYTGTAHLEAFDPHDCPGAGCQIATYDLPAPAHDLQGLASGPDGRIWFASSGAQGDVVGSVKTDGSDFQYVALPAGSKPKKITAGPAGDNSMWFTESGTQKIGRITGLAVSPALFLQNGRFKVEVSWSVPDQSRSGQGTPVSLTGDTGYFWFFNEANIELVLKVLDASAINHKFWVFYGALSDVAYTITVTDTVTGSRKVYDNPYHHLASFADTSAFQADALATEVVPDGPELAATDIDALSASELYALYGALTQVAPAPKAGAAGCAADGQTLCLNGGRFQVKVSWSAPSQGKSGEGQAVPITGDTGYFWFFSDNNVELIIKVLDGRGINGHYWVFYGALSNVQYTITVTDTQTTAHRVYENPDGTQASSADTSAF